MGLLKTVCYKYFNYKKQIPTLSGMENIWLRLSLSFFYAFSLYKIWSDIVYLSRPYHFKFFKGWERKQKTQQWLYKKA